MGYKGLSWVGCGLKVTHVAGNLGAGFDVAPNL